MPTLVVERQSGFGFPVADIDILLDGRERGSIGRVAKIEILVHAGAHALQARMGAVMSLPAYFKADERETIGFACVASGVWQRQLTLQRVFHRQPDDRFGRRTSFVDVTDQHEVSSAFRGDGSDWHFVLNVADTAGPEEVRRAYLDLIRRFHPDQLARMDAREKMAAENAARIVNNAYAAAKRKHRQT
jgi:DnaJ domain